MIKLDNNGFAGFGGPPDRADGKGQDLQKEFRRSVILYVVLTAVCVAGLYEYRLHLRSSATQTAAPPPEPQQAATGKSAQPEVHSSLSFIEELQKVREEEPEVTMGEARKLFTAKYKEHAKSLLCSGCKLTAFHVGEELTARNATHQPDPLSMMRIINQAAAEACEKLPNPLIISKGEKGAFFGTYQATDGHKLSAVEQRKAEGARLTAQRLCIGILGDAKLPMLEMLIRHKVPHAKHALGTAEIDNWERWLCARRVRVCKRSEVVDDDEDEDKDEL
mmetsp:Transcript_4560/g.11048  ORF Transcript_4560/g.11048 Transcript_4560/m.11048 type:complete len:277 (-) Transcript_4560:127-957(-)